MVETFEHWLERIRNLRRNNLRDSRNQREGQWLYNNMPNRFVGRVPKDIDPFNDDEKIEFFLEWLKKSWNY